MTDEKTLLNSITGDMIDAIPYEFNKLLLPYIHEAMELYCKCVLKKHLTCINGNEHLSVVTSVKNKEELDMIVQLFKDSGWKTEYCCEDTSGLIRMHTYLVRN